MTTIVYHSGRLFVDSRAYSGGKAPVGLKNKLHLLTGGVGAASTTIVGTSERLFELLQDNNVYTHIKEELDVTALYLQDTGDLFFYNGGPRWSQLDSDQPIAIGSGSQYALGAIAHGATGYEAMEVACALDVWSSLPISQSGAVLE